MYGSNYTLQSLVFLSLWMYFVPLYGIEASLQSPPVDCFQRKLHLPLLSKRFSLSLFIFLNRSITTLEVDDIFLQTIATSSRNPFSNSVILSHQRIFIYTCLGNFFKSDKLFCLHAFHEFERDWFSLEVITLLILQYSEVNWCTHTKAETQQNHLANTEKKYCQSQFQRQHNRKQHLRKSNTTDRGGKNKIRILLHVQWVIRNRDLPHWFVRCKYYIKDQCYNSRFCILFPLNQMHTN